MSKSNKILACISTPLQYINLLELFDVLDMSKSECVLIVYSHNKNTLNQINDISLINEWEKITTPFTVSSKFWIVSYIWVRLLFFYYKRRVMIVGNISDIKNRFLLNLYSNNCFVVDDGANSINFKNLITTSLVSKLDNWNSIIERVVFKNGQKLKNKNFTFFTVYKNLDLDRSITVLLNSFSRLKREYSAKVSNHTEVNEFWLVGAHFVKLGMIQQTTYKKILNSIKAFAETNKLKFIYFGHRSELEYDDDLFENIEVRTNSMPFELYVMQSEIKPKVIASFYSSSLFNLEILAKDTDLLSFNLLNGNILTEKSNKEHLTQIYNYIRDNSEIELRDIPNFNNF